MFISWHDTYHHIMPSHHIHIINTHGLPPWVKTTNHTDGFSPSGQNNKSHSRAFPIEYKQPTTTMGFPHRLSHITSPRHAPSQGSLTCGYLLPPHACTPVISTHFTWAPLCANPTVRVQSDVARAHSHGGTCLNRHVTLLCMYSPSLLWLHP